MNMLHLNGFGNLTLIAVLRRIGRVPVFLLLVWFLTIWWGEHATFGEHIQDCVWHNWETWVSGGNIKTKSTC